MTVHHPDTAWADSQARIQYLKDSPEHKSTVLRLYDTFDIAESQAAQVLMRAASYCRKSAPAAIACYLADDTVTYAQADEALAMQQAYFDADDILTDLVRQILSTEE